MSGECARWHLTTSYIYFNQLSYFQSILNFLFHKLLIAQLFNILQIYSVRWFSSCQILLPRHLSPWRNLKLKSVITCSPLSIFINFIGISHLLLSCSPFLWGFIDFLSFIIIGVLKGSRANICSWSSIFHVLKTYDLHHHCNKGRENWKASQWLSSVLAQKWHIPETQNRLARISHKTPLSVGGCEVFYVPGRILDLYWKKLMMLTKHLLSSY